MADPFSIAAGVAGLTSLGIRVTQGLVAYYTKYKHQDETIARTVHKLESLTSTLRTLNKASQNRSSQVDEAGELKDAVESCQEIISELENELEKFTSTSENGIRAASKRVGRKLAYPFRESTLKKLEEDVDEFKDLVLVALNVLQFKVVDHIQQETADLTLSVNSMKASQISDSIRDWLNAPDSTSDRNQACKRRHSKTGLWLVEGLTFNRWLEGHNSFLWMNGRPGSGKTVLSSTAIQYTFRHRRGNRHIGIAFYYFTFSDSSKRNVSGLLRTLLIQLSSQLDDGNAALAHLKNISRHGEPPEQALQDTLKQVVTKFQNVHIIVDALDESPRGEQRDAVLTNLLEMHRWSISGLHLLVTSRDELDIRDLLAPEINEEVSLDNRGVSADIKKYVAERLHCDHKLKKFESHFEEIEMTLCTRAHGVFRWVDCQFLSLVSCPSTLYHLRKKLNTLPRSLDETYHRMLMNIDPDEIEDAKLILMWLCFSKRPVTVREIAEALTVELGECPRVNRERQWQDPTDIIRTCPGLITITKNLDKDCLGSDKDSLDKTGAFQASLVRIAHFSVKEYLESSRIHSQAAEQFSLDSCIANTELAETCLVYLQNVQSTELGKFPLAFYAAKYWFKHFRAGDQGSDSLNSLTIDFLTSKNGVFEDSIRIHDPDDFFRHMKLKRSSESIPSPLYYTSLLGLYRPLQALLEIDSVRSTINVRNGGLGNALQAATYQGHVQIVQKLLVSGAEIDIQSGWFGNALQAASYQGHEQIVQLLINKGATMNGNEIEAAARWGHVETVQLLLNKGVTMNGNEIEAAAELGHVETVQLLLNKGVMMNGKEILAAAGSGDIETVQLLLNKGATINGKEIEAAAREGHVEMVQLLLDIGGEVDDETMKKAIWWASYFGYEEVVRLLLQQGILVESIATAVALRGASDGCHKNLVKKLLDRVAAIDDSAIEAAVQAAAKQGHVRAVQLLLDTGANFDADKALEMASERGHKEVVQLLLGRGAEIVASNAMQVASL